MLRSDLVAALMKRRDNDVHVDVGGRCVPVGGVDYDSGENRVKIRLDPVGLSDVLDMFAEDAVARVIVWRMHIQPRFAAMIASGEKTVEVRADHAWRGDLAEGDLILFDTGDLAQPSLLAFVHGVSRFVSLADLLDIHNPEAIAGEGGTSADVTALLAEIYPERPARYVAIEVSVLERGRSG